MNLPTGLNLLRYVRKSRADLEAEQRGEGETLSKHRRTLEQFSKSFRHNIIGTFEEIVSGERIIDRPEMQKLLHAVQEGSYEGKKIDGVLCMDLDRLGRGNMIDQGIIQDTFKTSKTLIVTPRKVYDLQDEFDEEYSEFESFMARRELKLINRRLQRGRKMSAREGKHIAKKAPYGYLRDKDLILHPDPDTAPIVKLIFEWAADGIGRNTIARRLMEMGIKSPSGKDRWDPTMVSRIVHNEVYLGIIIWGKGQWRKKKGGGYAQIRNIDPSKWTVKENAHEPLVDRDTFDKADEWGKSRSRPVHKDKQLLNPLSGFTVCSYCGRGMGRQPRKDRVGQDRFYCKSIGCENKSTTLNLVEERLIETLKSFVKGFEVETNEPPITNNHESLVELLSNKISALNKEKEALKTQSNNIHDLLEQGIYSVEKFVERNKELEERKDTIAQSIRDAQAELENIKEQQHRADDLMPQITNILSVYDSLSPQEKNDLLSAIIEKAVYTRKAETKKDGFELEVYLKF